MNGNAGDIERDSTGTMFHRHDGFAFAEKDHRGGWIAGRFSSFVGTGGIGYSEYVYVGGKRNPTRFATREEAEEAAAAL